MPFGLLGEIAHRLIVQGELRRIFRHRARTIAGIFAPVEVIDRPLTVAVAGGTGFVGGAIAAELHRRGHRVVVLSHRGEAARGPLPESIEIRAADVATGSGLDTALAGVDALAIALAFPNSPIEAPRRGRTFMAVDAAGTERLVAAASLVADFALVVTLCLPVVLLGSIVGVTFTTGLAGVVAFVLLSGAWGVAFTGFPYAIALRTGNPGAVAASFILFFPFAFLTTAYVPKEALSGWLATVADWNPVTYVLAGLRAIVSGGWEFGAIGGAIAATAIVGTISIGLALAALRRRIRIP